MHQCLYPSGFHAFHNGVTPLMPNDEKMVRRGSIIILSKTRRILYMLPVISRNGASPLVPTIKHWKKTAKYRGLNFIKSAVNAGSVVIIPSALAIVTELNEPIM